MDSSDRAQFIDSVVDAQTALDNCIKLIDMADQLESLTEICKKKNEITGILEQKMQNQRAFAEAFLLSALESLKDAARKIKPIGDTTKSHDKPKLSGKPTPPSDKLKPSANPRKPPRK